MLKFPHLLTGLCALILQMGCGEGNGLFSSKGDNAPAADDGVSGQCYGANDCPPGYMCNEFGYCSPIQSPEQSFDGGVADAGLPPEVEQPQRELPASGKFYVYVAVPEQDMVAKIHSESLQVRAIKVGQDPVALRTVAGQDVAVVLERISSTVTVIRSRADGDDDLTTLQTADGLNQLVLSPDGKHAVAFFDVTRSQGKLASKQNFQEVTVVTLDPGKEKAIDLTVGFKPSGVQFSKSGSHAYVITEEGISVIQLSAVNQPATVPPVPLRIDPLQEAVPEEVLVTPDGKLALARLPGLAGIRTVELASGSIIDIPLSSVPTDLDLTPDGGLAVAIQREANLIALIDIPADLQDPSGDGVDLLPTGGYQAGQATLSPDGLRAFLFTNATNQEVVLVADLTSRNLDIIPLKKGVRSVLCAPDGKTLLILHNKIPGTPNVQEGFDAYVDKSFGYSLLQLDASFDKLLLTSADPGPVAFAPDSLSAYLLLNDPTWDIRSVEAIDLQSFLVESVAVGSPPVALGVVATTSMVYVAQNHPLGRVTFIDMESRQTKTVTGFELNSHIIE